MSQPPAVPSPAPNGAAPTGDGTPSRRPPWPPDPFAYLDGRLCVGGLPLDEVVADAVAIHRCDIDEIWWGGQQLAPRAAARVRRALTGV